MKIIIVGDRPVAPDGLNVITWKDGEIHDAPVEMAESMIRSGHAREAGPGPAENKVISPASTKTDPPLLTAEEMQAQLDALKAKTGA